MLRMLALILLLANGLYYAWGHELLRAYGLGPEQQTEPQRLAQQLAPERVRLLSAEEFSRAEEELKLEQAPKECLQAGPFDEEQVAALRQALGALLPANAWQEEELPIAERWIVYMGKYASAYELVKKRAQLASLNLKFEPLQNPALGPGLSLGGFDTQDEANKALAAFSQRGVRTARVLQERAEERGLILQLPVVDDAVKAGLTALQPALAGKPLSPCR